MTHPCLAERAKSCPASTGVYRLYRGARIIHVGMAAGAATLRSELLAHAAGEYGAETQAADKVDWEVAPDAAFAYRRFLSLYAAATYLASGGASGEAAPSSSKRHSLSVAA
jgi:hypothetical protein